ncbi:phage holin family protein [candidate division KSB3 bacterium]|uniref:Phage holin family protein n=1 Tax=candidate division KSB3 bacterium TaxID=2044937 RepID=A0A9D5Q4Q5_9BACT|nr:phage holin family protein [candidate division KSB3 bacterium]MBD3323161.1 phage holin family protein [candidate division KSB3 bacterium]
MLILLIHLVIVAIAIIAASYIIPRIRVRNFATAFLTAVVLGLINLLIRPILMFLTLPINILTFGLFTFVINGLLLKLVAELIEGFTVEDWLSAILGSVLISVLTVIMQAILL